MFQKARITWLELSEAGLLTDRHESIERIKTVPGAHIQQNEVFYTDGTVLYWHPDLGQWRWRNAVGA